MIRSQRATVKNITRNDEVIQELIVDVAGKEERAVNYPLLTGPVEIGQQVLLNTTAVHLQLGTGGVHFVMHGGFRERDTDLSPERHIMKLRYTPLQIASGSCEEPGSPYHARLKEQSSIDGMPVLVAELHSMLPIAVTYIKHKNKELRIVYIMPDSAALPLAMSRHVQHLQDQGALTATITIGQAFGGDVEAVNIYSGLLAAKHVFGADLAIVAMGPGIVGTGTALGFSGMDQVSHLHAAYSLKGVPILVPRIGEGDHRERHRGISHHTIQVLRHTLVPIHLPLWMETELPLELPTAHHLYRRKKDEFSGLEQILNGYPEPIRTMGRGIKDDPLFFYTTAMAADLALFLAGGANARPGAETLARLGKDSTIL